MINTSLETFSKLRLLLEVEGIGPGKLFNLISKFQSIDNLFSCNFNSLINVEGISSNLANRILISIDRFPEFIKKMEEELSTLNKLDAHWITFWSKEYPKILKNIFSPPVLLYYKGDLNVLDLNPIAVVGTRMPTSYGKNIASKITEDLAKKSITIVSGMARGIDTIAHRSSLRVGGKTVAVIGTGLDIIYPSENKKLFYEICENGAVISEYPLGTKPDAQNFPKRNRIISGLSLGTLVVETKISGGALQTAAFALEQNREVFAVPGNLGVAQSEGTNLLIQKGEAKLITSYKDILVELNLTLEPKIGENIPLPSFDLNLFEQKVYDSLSNQPKHIDIISAETNLNSGECLVHLLTLEFRNLVRQLPGKMFIKN